MFEAIATLAMQVAQYFSVCDTRSPQWRHYALNIPYYTHFTSPIRRYADVMVHRLLQAALDGPDVSISSKLFPDHHCFEVVSNMCIDVIGNIEQAVVEQESSDSLDKQCQQCNDKKLAADGASDDSARVFMCLYLRDNPTTTGGVILSVGLKSFTVYEPKWGLQKLVYVDKCFAQGFLDEETRTLTLLPHWAKPMPVEGEEESKAEPSEEQEELSLDRFDSSIPRLVLRIMTKVTVELVANMERVPIDFDMELQNTLAWRSKPE